MAAPYTASKHAVIGLTKVAAVEYAARSVRVTRSRPDSPLRDGR
ncbi:SDR family NAD(P)-dependent oxidoreductase [Streptomyces longisporus]